jgi:hypothetical protein
MLCNDNVTHKGTNYVQQSSLVFFIGCMFDHKWQQMMSFTWFTLSASAMSAIFFSLVGFRVGNVLPEMESTNSLLMNNCNRGEKIVT